MIGTLLAMARLSNIPACPMIAGAYVNLIRSMPLVLVIFWFYFLVPYIGQWITGASPADPGRRISFGAGDVHVVRSRLFLRDHARRHPVDPARPGAGGAGARHGLLDLDGLEIILPQAFRNMVPVLLTQTIISVSGHVAGLRDLGHRFPRRSVQGRPARRAPGRDVSVRRRSSILSSRSPPPTGVRRLQHRIAIIR